MVAVDKPVKLTIGIVIVLVEAGKPNCPPLILHIYVAPATDVAVKFTSEF